MQIRKLNNSDALGMLEWMHDPEISSHFRTDFSRMTKKDVQKFILDAQNFHQYRHYAIVDDEDKYLGTISLKEIDLVNMKAEYAIVLRKEAMGKGVAYHASKMILRIAFQELGLNKVYLNVLSNNKRAIELYERLGFKFEGCFRQELLINGKFEDLNWYAIIKESYEL